jgi:lipase chaperone LimK
VATPDAIDFFDYYLSAFGEEPLEAIVARIEAAIRARVDPPDAALGLLEQYLAYRDAVRRLVETEGLEALPIERRLQRLRETRRAIFGADVADALFADDETRARNAIEWRRVAADPDLDDEERAERLAALEAAWPEAERERRTRATVADRILARDSALRNEGASEDEIGAVRAAEFGDATAARLAEIDRARAAWTARVEGYRDERARLSATAIADEVEAAAELEALRARWFEGPELIRIRALDEFEQSGARSP